MRKNIAVLFFLITICSLGFTDEYLLCDHVADIISIGAYRYYRTNGKMPETLEELKNDKYILNYDNTFKEFDKSGYKYELTKLSDSRIRVTTCDEYLKFTIIYEKKDFHVFTTYMNDSLEDVYYGDDTGKRYIVNKK